MIYEKEIVNVATVIQSFREENQKEAFQQKQFMQNDYPTLPAYLQNPIAHNHKFIT